MAPTKPQPPPSLWPLSNRCQTVAAPPHQIHGFVKRIQKRTGNHTISGLLLWNDSKTNTIPGYRFAITLSFCIGCIWVQNRCGWVQIVARWVQHRAFVLEAAFYFAPKDAPRRKHRNYCTFQLLQWCLPGIPCRMDVSRGKRKIATGCDPVAA